MLLASEIPTMLKPDAEKHLKRFDDLMRAFSKASHHHPADYPKAVDMCIAMIEENGYVHQDDVRQWFESAEWRKEDARDMGEMAETVWYVLRSKNLVPGN